MTNPTSRSQGLRKTMPGMRLLAAGSMLMFALTLMAQETNSKPGGAAENGVPKAEEQLKVLTEKLDLTGAQQARIKPILQQLHDATLKLEQDESLSHDERLAKVRPWRYKTDKKIRKTLNDDQKKKLDQFEQGPHSEMHGNLSGAPAPTGPR